jgi:MFS family permease
MSVFPIKRLYVSELISQSLAIYPMYAIMFSERSGLSLAQVGVILAVFSITTIIAEVPTGAIADHFSRKWSLLFSRLILALGMLLWLVWPTMPGYIAGIIAMGISEALYSGAMQAYLYEQLGDDKKEFTKLNSRLWAMMMAGWTLGAGLASVIGPDYQALLVLSILSPLIGLAITATLPGDRHDVAARRDESEGSMWANTKAAAHYIVHSRTVLYAVLSLVFIRLLVDVLIEYIPLFYKGAGASTRIIPVLFFAGNIITTILFWYGKHIAALLRKKELLTGALFVLLLLITSRLGMGASILGIFWYVRVVRILYVAQEGEIQHVLIDRHRATVTSIYSMVTRLLMAFSLVLIGQFADGSRGVIGPILVFVPVVYGLYVLVYRRNNRHALRQPEPLAPSHPTA